jgi:hypothetical protein
VFVKIQPFFATIKYCCEKLCIAAFPDISYSHEGCYLAPKARQSVPTMPSNLERKERRKRQTKLTFESSPAPASLPIPAKSTRPIRPATITKKSPRKMGKVDSSDGSSPEDEDETATQKIRKGKAKKISFTTKLSNREKSVTLSDESDDELSLPPPRKSNIQVKPAIKIPSSAEIVELDDDSDEIITTSSVRKRHNMAPSTLR